MSSECWVWHNISNHCSSIRKTQNNPGKCIHLLEDPESIDFGWYRYQHGCRQGPFLETKVIMWWLQTRNIHLPIHGKSKHLPFPVGGNLATSKQFGHQPGDSSSKKHYQNNTIMRNFSVFILFPWPEQTTNFHGSRTVRRFKQNIAKSFIVLDLFGFFVLLLVGVQTYTWQQGQFVLGLTSLPWISLSKHRPNNSIQLLMAGATATWHQKSPRPNGFSQRYNQLSCGNVKNVSIFDIGSCNHAAVSTEN